MNKTSIIFTSLLAGMIIVKQAQTSESQPKHCNNCGQDFAVEHGEKSTSLDSFEVTAGIYPVSAPVQNEESRSGWFIYHSRCMLCHGEDGKGTGRMAKVILDPPPSDLTLSTAGRDETIRIIKEGGKSVGRSHQMPPWDDELNEKQIDSLITYLLTIRK